MRNKETIILCFFWSFYFRLVPVNILYLLQSIFGIIWQDKNDLAVRILSQNPLFFPSLEIKGAFINGNS